ncbi:MAG TPA: hypothetical protein VLH58_02520 [Candidatus Methylomirabilis sp.]|nr:hypothetical protein [Candidatus Methylomirabilis sp.]
MKRMWQSSKVFAILVASVASGAVSLLAGGIAAGAQPSVETPPVLSAKQFLPPQLLAGPRFRVDEQVPTSDLVARFTLRSDFGAFEAHGVEMLRVRVAELAAIEQLEATSKTGTFLKAAGSAAARPVQSASNIIMSPVETAKGIPGGVSRFYDRLKMGGQHIAEAASDSGKSDEEKAAEVSRRVGSVSVDVLGYDDERRALAKSLHVDPYTTNPVLAEKLTDVAWVAFSGRLGVNTLVSVAVPGSMALSATSITNDMVWDTKPADLLKRHAETLAAMGVADKDTRALLKNQWYSLTVLTVFMNGLERLPGATGRPEVVTLAAGAASEDDAQFFTGVVQMLARYQETTGPIVRLVARGTVIGYNRTGAVVVPAPVDYLSWTQRIGNFARRTDLKAKERSVWLSGRISPRAKQEFEALGWEVHEEALRPKAAGS